MEDLLKELAWCKARGNDPYCRAVLITISHLLRFISNHGRSRRPCYFDADGIPDLLP